jgi:hypothetical protein
MGSVSLLPLSPPLQQPAAANVSCKPEIGFPKVGEPKSFSPRGFSENAKRRFLQLLQISCSSQFL